LGETLIVGEVVCYEVATPFLEAVSIMRKYYPSAIVVLCSSKFRSSNDAILLQARLGGTGGKR
jgi:hypothetical protein